MKTLLPFVLSLIFSLAVTASHNDPAAVKARIAPVGELNIMTPEEAQAMAEAAAMSADDVAAAEDGEAVYNASCVVCHGAGIAGAPRVGDIPTWTERIAQGMALLTEHAIRGYQGETGVMPAKGGNPALSDAAVTAAVEFMVQNSQ